MTVNGKLKDTAIKEYLEEKEKLDNKHINDNVKRATMVMAVLYLAVFGTLAFRDYFSGRFADGIETFSIGMAVAIAFLLPSCLFTWMLLRKRASDERIRTEEELRKTTYSIEEDSLVKRIDGDGRRTKRYKIEQIRSILKDGFVITFEYGNEEVEILDYYEPSLFEILNK